MRLLIVTQSMDENDPVLGFFVSWVREFAKHAEHIEVICLREGLHAIPGNVRVHHLGEGKGIRKIARFIRYVFLVYSLRREYTHVYAHMSPEFVIAGAPVWFLSRKKATLWYNHTQKSFRLSLAARLVKLVFHTSPYAASAVFPHSRRMPAGIDTELFKPRDVPKNPVSVYFQGRVAVSKRVREICEAVRKVREDGLPATLTVVGPEDSQYVEELKEEYERMVRENALAFLGPRKPADTPFSYSAARVSVNLTAAGNYDKTVLESMACGTPVIVSSLAFEDMVPEEWTIPEHDTHALAERIVAALRLPEGEYHELGTSLRGKVVQKHSLPKLGDELFSALSSL